MTKKLQSIINKLSPFVFIIGLLIVWQACSDTGAVPKFMLPSPVDSVKAFISDFSALMKHSATTLTEAFLGLFISLVLSFGTSCLMDRFNFINKALYPVLVITQTIPTVAIAPLLVLWMGVGMAPKIVLVVIVCFFPITVGLIGGYNSADKDTISLMHAMGATKYQIFKYIKLPSALPEFFSGLRIAIAYCVVGAVIAEWLGGMSGLGVYMTRVRKAYAFDKMFAVIFLISIISLILIESVKLLEKKTLKWRFEK